MLLVNVPYPVPVGQLASGERGREGAGGREGEGGRRMERWEQEGAGDCPS